MTDDHNPHIQRDFSSLDAKRISVVLALAAGVAVCNWFLLPALQSLIIPTTAGGPNGPWLVRPIMAFHFCATAVMTAVTLPLLQWPLQKLWKREDAEAGTQYNPLHGQPAKRNHLFAKGMLLLVVYGAGLVFYLFSWTIIGPAGIEQRLPWGTSRHTFNDVKFLEVIPDGQRSDSNTQNGPWYSVKLSNGSSLMLSHDNEGTTTAELAAVAQFIADRTGLKWVRRSDARAR